MYCMDEKQTYDDEEWGLVWALSEDYLVFENADEDEAWRLLRRKIAPPPRIGLYVSIAATVVLAIGAACWGYFEGKRPVRHFETAIAGQKAIPLADGSVVVLEPRSELEITEGYNTLNRTVVLISGRARFTVAHQNARTFIVDMDLAQVRDIATSFTVEKTTDSIHVSVTSGKVAFFSKRDSLTRDVAKGGSMCLITPPGGFPTFRETAAPAPMRRKAVLRFADASLFDVLSALEQHTRKRMYLEDPALGHEKLTIDLDGKTINDAIDDICATLNLKCELVDGAYVFEKKPPGN